MQCLPQLQADDTGADHRYRFRQVVPFEYVVVDQQARTEVLQTLRYLRTRAGGDHHALGGNDGVIVNL